MPFGTGLVLEQVFLPGEAQGHQVGQGQGGDGAGAVGHVDRKIRAAEFRHHLAADTAGGAKGGDLSTFAAANGDGGKVPVAVVDGLEKGGALGAVGGAVGGIFDIAALIDRAVGAQQRRAYIEAGIRGVGLPHGLLG